MSEPTIGQVFFPERDLSLSGQVVYLHQNQVILRFASSQKSFPDWIPGIPAQLHFAFETAVFTGTASLKAMTDMEISLLIEKLDRKRNGRRERRRKCHLEALYRPIRNDGCYGVWQNGRIVNISCGGIGMVIPACSEPPRRLELAFLWSKQEDRASENVESVDATVPWDAWKGEEELAADVIKEKYKSTPIRSRMRVAHFSRLPDDQVKMGLVFTNLSQFDQLRIYQYMDSLPDKGQSF